MKRLILFLMLLSIPAVYAAQSFSKDGKTHAKSNSNSVNAEKNSYWIANSTEVFIEVVIEEYYSDNNMKVNLILGDNYSSVLTKREDIKLFDNLFSEVTTMNNVPDLLGYLTEEGFEILNYVSFPLDDYVRHQIILSQRFEK